MSTTTPETFAWSSDGERYHDEFGSRAEALAFGRAETGGGETIWTGRRVPVVLSHPFDAGDLQERIRDMLYDQIGEASDDYETTAEADTAWTELVGAWVEAHGLASVQGFFGVVEIEEHEP